MFTDYHSISQPLHDGINNLGLMTIEEAILDIGMSTIGQHRKGYLLILIRPGHNPCGAVMSEAVAHLAARTIRIETIRTGVVVA
jgi:hypothetical protein